jgi:hypothetical protein
MPKHTSVSPTRKNNAKLIVAKRNWFDPPSQSYSYPPQYDARKYKGNISFFYSYLVSWIAYVAYWFLFTPLSVSKMDENVSGQCRIQRWNVLWFLMIDRFHKLTWIKWILLTISFKTSAYVIGLADIWA